MSSRIETAKTNYLKLLLEIVPESCHKDICQCVQYTVTRLENGIHICNTCNKVHVWIQKMDQPLWAYTRPPIVECMSCEDKYVPKEWPDQWMLCDGCNPNPVKISDPPKKEWEHVGGGYRRIDNETNQ